MTLEDDEIVLRRFTEDNVPALVEALDDPETPRWTRIPSPDSEDDARTFLRSASEEAFAITSRESGGLLGGIGVRFPSEGVGEVGYWE